MTEVRCPAGSGTYEKLLPSIPLNATPYAHSLRPGAVISSETAGTEVGGAGAVLTVMDAYNGAFASKAIKGESTNGTGVYGKGGTYGVYSDGNAHVEGNLTWKAQTGYVSVAAAGCQPSDDGYTYINSGYNLYPDDSSSYWFVCPVQLPHGATVTRFTFYWRDSSSSTFEGECELRRSNFTSSLMAKLSTNGSAGVDDSDTTTTITNPVVDNAAYAYWLQLYFPDANVDFYYAVIEYTYTTTH